LARNLANPCLGREPKVTMTMKSDDQTHLVDKILIKCVPSNLSGRLIYGSFGWGYVLETHPKEVET